MSEDLRFIKMFYGNDGGFSHVHADEESSIDAAVSLWLDSGETRDTLLSLTLLEGAILKVRASSIESWSITTPEYRRRYFAYNKALEEERKAMRAELGIYEDDQ